MAERIKKEQVELAVSHLNGTILAMGGKLQLYLSQQNGYSCIRSRGSNKIFYCGTVRGCKEFVDGTIDILLLFGG